MALVILRLQSPGSNSSGVMVEDPIPVWFTALFVAHLFIMLLWLKLILVYLRFLFKTNAVPTEQKAFWTVVILLFGILAMPVFWYLYFWRRPLTHHSPLTHSRLT